MKTLVFTQADVYVGTYVHISLIDISMWIYADMLFHFFNCIVPIITVSYSMHFSL